MTRQEEEAEVSRLLKDRSALLRFGLELPPQKLLLLKRLLYRLGWTKMLNSKKKYGRTQTTDLLLNQLHEDYTKDPKSVAPGTTLRLIAADAFDEADEPHVAETLRSDNPIFTFGREDAPPRIFKVIAGTTYDAKTPHEVVRHLESARLGRHRIRLHYGDTETGRDWMEEHDVAGTVGRSMGNGQGLHRTPILLATNRSRGGLTILDHAIVRIRDNRNRDLWRHPNYHHGKVDVISLDHPSFGSGYNPLRDTHPYKVLVDNKSHAGFQTMKALQMWIKRMGLTVGPQESQRMERKKYARDSDRNPLIKGLQEHTLKFRGKGDMTPSLIFADHLAETGTPGEVAIREAVKANDVWREDLETGDDPGFHAPQRMVVDGEDYEPGKEYWWGVSEARQNKEFPWVFHVTHRGDKDSGVGYGGRPYTPVVTHSVGVKSLGHLMHLMRDFPEIHRTQARKAAQAWLQRRQNLDRLSRKKYARLTLGASRPFRGPMGEAMTEHDYHDESGQKLGVIRIQPRNDGQHLHIHWVGPENAKGGDPAASNAVGPEGMLSLKKQLKGIYPQAQFISGVRAGGFRHKEGGKGSERVVRTMQRKVVKFAGRKRFSTSDPLILHAAAALNDPLDNTVMHSFADHVAERHPGPMADDFLRWVQGQATTVDMAPHLKPSIYWSYANPNSIHFPEITPYHHIHTRSGEHGDRVGYRREYLDPLPLWTQTAPVRGTQDLETHEAHRNLRLRKLTSPEVAHNIYHNGGIDSLVLAVIGARQFHPTRNQGSKVPKEFKRKNAAKKYAKVDGHEPAHPLVAGFPIEYALRHLANDPKNSDDIRNLASAAVTGKDRITGQVKPEGMPEALFLLHDALQEHQNEDGTYGHPMAKAYNWMSAAGKVQLDQKTYQALIEHSNQMKVGVPPQHHHEFAYTPESHAMRAAHGMRKGDARRDLGLAANRAYLHRLQVRVRELSPETDPKLIDESIRRHAFRAEIEWRKRHTPETSTWRLDDHLKPLGTQNPTISETSGSEVAERERAARYSKRNLPVKRYSLAVRGDFIDSLRRIKSSNQEALHKTAEEVAKKLGFSETKIFAALHDSPRGSVPGLAQAIYGQAAPEHIHAAAAWIGLTGNLPGVAVFHVRDKGPDVLYRMRQDGSGLDIRQKLDRYGLTNRILVPHKKGFDIIIPDKGSILSKNVWGYSQKHGLTLELSNGFFSTIGSQDQAKARDMFRSAVVRSEKMARKPKKYGRLAPRIQEFVPVIRGALKRVKDSGAVLGHDEYRQLQEHGVLADWLDENDDPRGIIVRKMINEPGPPGGLGHLTAYRFPDGTHMQTAPLVGGENGGMYVEWGGSLDSHGENDLPWYASGMSHDEFNHFMGSFDPGSEPVKINRETRFPFNSRRGRAKKYAGEAENAITKHYNTVKGFAYNLTKDHDSAEELTQHAMSVGLQKLPVLHDPSVEPKVRAYLFQIVRNKHLRNLRDQKRHKEVTLDAASETASPQATPESAISNEQLHAALGKINPVYADTLRLHYLEGKSQQEIADHHGVPLMTVGTRLFKGRQLLKGLLSHKLSRRLFRHVGA